MAFDEELANRVAQVFKGKHGITQKMMFGGLAFFIHGNMCAGITNKSELMLRVGKEQYDELLDMDFAKPMTFTGRSMKGFLFVEPEGIEKDDELEKWVGYAMRFVQSLPKKNV